MRNSVNKPADSPVGQPIGVVFALEELYKTDAIIVSLSIPYWAANAMGDRKKDVRYSVDSRLVRATMDGLVSGWDGWVRSVEVGRHLSAFRIDITNRSDLAVRAGQTLSDWIPPRKLAGRIYTMTPKEYAVFCLAAENALGHHSAGGLIGTEWRVDALYYKHRIVSVIWNTEYGVIVSDPKIRGRCFPSVDEIRSALLPSGDCQWISASVRFNCQGWRRWNAVVVLFSRVNLPEQVSERTVDLLRGTVRSMVYQQQETLAGLLI